MGSSDPAFGFAERLSRLALAHGTTLLGLTFVGMAFAAGQQVGFRETEPGDGLLGLQRQVFLFLALAALLLFLGPWLWVRTRRDRRRPSR